MNRMGHKYACNTFRQYAFYALGAFILKSLVPYAQYLVKNKYIGVYKAGY